MISNRVIFPAKAASESLLLQFNFLSRLAPAETINSVAVSAAVWSGNDSSPSGIISGAASISGTTVTQLVVGGVLGTTYELSCLATTSLGQKLLLAGYLVILPDVT
jgi:hypothetical protein